MRVIVLLGFVLCLLESAVAAHANPTGAALLTHPVEPCRVLDTRTSLGALPGQTAMNVFVRGSLLNSADGAAQTDCGVPPEAEAVQVNVAAITPTATGALKINGTGFVFGPKGAYSRLNYRVGQNVANEMTVSLCNRFLFPHAHEPCALDGQGRYLDFQILNTGPAGSSVQLVVDVVGYLER